MTPTFPESVELVETVPRDGLQSPDRFVPTDEKVGAIDDLATTGVAEVEITSFTHSDAVPNLRDAEAVVGSIADRLDLDPTSHVLRGGTPERVLAAAADWS